MRKAFKKYFIPHEENGYHPHILHTKRAVAYSAFFVLLKGVLVVFAMSIPTVAFVMPDVLAIEQEKIIQLTNELRAQVNAGNLNEEVKLNTSGQLKADDMARGQYFAHVSPDGNGLGYFLKQAKYSYTVAGENLAMGFSSAPELFDAWVKSPTHYANLVDTDFKHIGIGVTSGLYDGLSTVYVAQHFGAPKNKSAATPEITTPVVQVATVSSTAVEEAPVPTSTADTSTPVVEPTSTPSPTFPVVAAEKKTDIPVEAPKTPVVATSDAGVSPTTTVSAVIYDETSSFISWTKEGDGMRLFAHVVLESEIQNIWLEIKQYPVAVTKHEDGIYRGDLFIPESPDTFFRVIFPGVVHVLDEQGELFMGNIAWRDVPVVGPTPFDRYTLAKDRATPFLSVFHFSQYVYTGFLIFFICALLLNIFIEIRRQHVHVIGQTLGVIGLLFFLIVL